MNIIETYLSGVPLLTIVGEVDHALGPQVAQAAQRAMGAGGTHILWDLELCPYLDSSALSVIIDLVEQVQPRGWVGVVNCSGMVLRLFDQAGLGTLSGFRVFQNLDEAGAAAAAV